MTVLRGACERPVCQKKSRLQSADIHLRTDEAFSQIEYSRHQTGSSPLIAAGIPCVSAFVLDYMHAFCLGVVRRMLVYLTRGPKLCRLSQKLNILRGQMPSEFARQPGGLQELDRWKATEFRQFLLYTGPIVLKNTVSSKLYCHFVTLNLAVSIMLDSDDGTRAAYLDFYTELMRHFVSGCPALYGKTFTKEDWKTFPLLKVKFTSGNLLYFDTTVKQM